jgi:cell division ATPase FtsA
MRALDTVINARLGELFSVIRSDLDAAGALHRLNGGIVLTGGSARTLNINSLARNVFGGAVRTGSLIPGIEGFENDEFPARRATIAGALMLELKNSDDRSLFDPISNLWKKFFSS